MVYLLLFLGLLLLSERVVPCFSLCVCVVCACLIISREVLPMENSLRDFPPDSKCHNLLFSVLIVYFPGTASTNYLNNPSMQRRDALKATRLFTAVGLDWFCFRTLNLNLEAQTQCHNCS